MSGANAAFSLPPGDRDDAEQPKQTGGLSNADTADAGRKHAAAEPESAGVLIERLGVALDEAQLRLGELRMARTGGDPALIEAARHRLNEALMADPRVLGFQIGRALRRQGSSR